MFTSFREEIVYGYCHTQNFKVPGSACYVSDSGTGYLISHHHLSPVHYYHTAIGYNIVQSTPRNLLILIVSLFRSRLTQFNQSRINHITVCDQIKMIRAKNLQVGRHTLQVLVNAVEEMDPLIKDFLEERKDLQFHYQIAYEGIVQ